MTDDDMADRYARGFVDDLPTERWALYKLIADAFKAGLWNERARAGRLAKAFEPLHPIFQERTMTIGEQIAESISRPPA